MLKSIHTAKTRLYLILLAFFSVYTLNLILPMGGEHPASYRLRGVVMTYAVVIAAACFVMIHLRKHLTYRHILIGVLLGLLPAGGNVQLVLNGDISYSYTLLTCVTTTMAYMAGSAIAKRYDCSLRFFTQPVKKTIVRDTVFALFVALLLIAMSYGGLSVFEDIADNMSMVPLVAADALSPGVSEEVIMSFFLFSLGVWAVRGKPQGVELFLCFVLMTLPFVLAHFPDDIVAKGFSRVLLSLYPYFLLRTILVALCYKRNLYSGILAHVMIDFLQFMMFI